MKIVKYDKSRAGSGSGSGGSSGGSSSTEVSRGADLDRNIWGQQDTGDDINGSMTVYGSVNIKTLVYEDDDEDITGDVDDYENEVGNLFVDEDVSVGKNLHVGNHLYIKHSHSQHNTSEVCVSQLIKSCEDDISTNKSEISSLKTRVTTAETNISNNSSEITSLKTRVTNAETNITTNTNDIDELKKKVSSNSTDITNQSTDITEIQNFINNNSFISESKLNEILDLWQYGSPDRPVILLSGYLYSTIAGSWNFFGSSLKCVDILPQDITINDGLMTIGLHTNNIFENKKISNIIQSVHVTQMQSGTTGNDVTANPYLKERSDGACWFETSYNNVDKTIHIREFHQGNSDNDTWYSSDWSGTGPNVNKINITVIGYTQILSM